LIASCLNDACRHTALIAIAVAVIVVAIADFVLWETATESEPSEAAVAEMVG
jgi:hypothetical protein